MRQLNFNSDFPSPREFSVRLYDPETHFFKCGEIVEGIFNGENHLIQIKQDTEILPTEEMWENYQFKMDAISYVTENRIAASVLNSIWAIIRFRHITWPEINVLKYQMVEELELPIFPNSRHLNDKAKFVGQLLSRTKFLSPMQIQIEFDLVDEEAKTERFGMTMPNTVDLLNELVQEGLIICEVKDTNLLQKSVDLTAKLG